MMDFVDFSATESNQNYMNTWLLYNNQSTRDWLTPRYIMGLTSFFDYLWVIENIVSHVEVVLHTRLEDVPKAWKQELELGQK